MVLATARAGGAPTMNGPIDELLSTIASTDSGIALIYRSLDSLTVADLAATARKFFTDRGLIVTTLSKDALPAGMEKAPALSSLAAANLAATDGLARLVGEPEFSILYHQGKHRNIHISDVSRRYCLVLVFDEKVSLGLVRLRVKQTTAYLEEVFKLFARKTETKKNAAVPSNSPSPFDFTDEDIDKLFGR